MRPFHGHHMNADELKKTRVDRAKILRAWQFGRPYKKLLIGYIVTAFLTSFYGVLPPLVFRRFIDHTIPARDLAEVNLLAIVLIVLTIANSALGVLTRWMSTRLGEGVIAPRAWLHAWHHNASRRAGMGRFAQGDVYRRPRNPPVWGHSRRASRPDARRSAASARTASTKTLSLP